MSHDDLRRRLQDAGRAPAPPPSPAFAAHLEARLRAVAATSSDDATRQQRQTGDGGRRSTPRRPWLRSPAAVAAALVLVLAGGLTWNIIDPDPGALRLTAAVDATVTLPDGTAQAARAGLRLSDGTVIVTGPRGRVVTSHGALGPGQIAVVRGRRVERVQRTAEPEPPVTARPQRPATPPPDEPSRRDAPAVAVPLPPDSIGEPAPRPEAEPARPTTRPEPADEPTRGTETPTRTPDDERPPSRQEAPGGVATGVAEPDDAHAVGLRAELARDGVALRWTAFEHPDFAFYVVVRSTAPQKPAWPPADRAQLVGRSGDHERRHLFDPGPFEGRPVYRVVALDRDGRELARSRAVTPASPDRQR